MGSRSTLPRRKNRSLVSYCTNGRGASVSEFIELRAPKMYYRYFCKIEMQPPKIQERFTYCQ
ncbi:MAG: hypothetical protein EWV91_12390 [Microcystis aeruginosa Ma_QC_Ca_00000000_S207]|uniref:Uncharacterized protein n=1 Tax=Microcystis aeruginosa Ma_QC_Ca_00000000_S207 TaxID=2486251 RepID=A0A552FIX9_MICAE|nr:MAG: hypothetical protein EWV91_12390 [Microcystis aeruginosa Ma_QC_Ca_00000000_S207]